MRALFLLLVLANVGFLAWSRLLSSPEMGTDPAPLGRQVEPERLKILPPAEPGTPAKPAAAAPALACLEWGSFPPEDAPKAEKALEALALGDRLARRRTEEPPSWWVYIPPQANRQAALKKAAEVKAFGVEEFFVVSEDSAFRWAVSLGVFRTEEAAQVRLSALRERGVRSAQIGPREAPVPRIWLVVKDADAALESRLREAAQGFESTELRRCADPAGRT